MGTVEVVEAGAVPHDLPFGKISAVASEAAYCFIERACKLAMRGEVQAICTAPISKEALHAAGHRYPGHTELLAHLTGTPEVSMMLTAPKLRVIHVTTQMGLIDAIERIDGALVERTITRGRAMLLAAGFANPRIGVCAINPHARLGAWRPPITSWTGFGGLLLGQRLHGTIAVAALIWIN